MGPTLLALLSVFLFGLRHGVDHDHIAAITDIAGSIRKPKLAMKLGLTYAMGHAVVVLMLAVAAIFLRDLLPASFDQVLERIVGLTLIGLGFFLLQSLLRNIRSGESSAHPTRFGILRLIGTKLGLNIPDAPRQINHRGAFGVGMIHGIGAETPTQLGLFLFAAGVGGKLLAFIGVAVFVLGLVISNSIICAVATGAFQYSRFSNRVYAGLAGLSAAYSVVIGTVLLVGR